MSDPLTIAREVLGVPQRAIMEDLDEIDKRLDALIADNRNLRSERDALRVELCQTAASRNAEVSDLRAEVSTLAERLRQTPDLRSIVGELRQLNQELNCHGVGRAQMRVQRLLCRLDRESEGQ